MIKQAPVKGRKAVKVSFVLLNDAIAGKTRKGSKWLRKALVEAAHAASRTDTYLAAQFARLRGRRGPKKAAVGVATRSWWSPTTCSAARSRTPTSEPRHPARRHWDLQPDGQGVPVQQLVALQQPGGAASLPGRLARAQAGLYDRMGLLGEARRRRSRAAGTRARAAPRARPGTGASAARAQRAPARPEPRRAGPGTSAACLGTASLPPSVG